MDHKIVFEWYQAREMLWVRRRGYLVGCDKARLDLRRWSQRIVREASLGDLDSLCELVPKRATYLARFENDERSFVVEKAGRILAMVWVCCGERREPMLGTVFHLGVDGAWVYDGFTAPEARGCGYHPLLLYRAAEYAKECGRVRCYGLIESDNTVSLRTHLRFGYEVVGEMIYTRIGMFHGCWRKPYQPTGCPSWWSWCWRSVPYRLSASLASASRPLERASVVSDKKPC
jgi:GNAT superfamily N-acetyltransferase